MVSLRIVQHWNDSDEVFKWGLLRYGLAIEHVSFVQLTGLPLSVYVLKAAMGLRAKHKLLDLQRCESFLPQLRVVLDSSPVGAVP